MKRTILVVDDNPVNLKLACDVLEAAGFAVHRAVDAATALAAIEQNSPELILMDIDLPGMDGLTLTGQIKNDPSTQHIKVIAVTAFAMKGDDKRMIAKGCDGYVSKPINTRTLPGYISQCLDKLQF